MERKCEQCGKSYEARSTTSKFCSRPECKAERETARKRRQRAGGSNLPPAVRLVAAGPSPAVDLEGVLAPGIEPAVQAELAAASRSDSIAGRAALSLARRIDRWSEKETGSSYAALIRELRATVEAALAGAKVVGPVDELRTRRLQRSEGA